MKQAYIVEQIDSCRSIAKDLQFMSLLLIEQLNLAHPTLAEIKEILVQLKNEKEISEKSDLINTIFQFVDDNIDTQVAAIKKEFNYDILNFHRYQTSLKYTSTKSWQTLQDTGNIKLIKTDGNTSMIIHDSGDNKQQLLIKDELNNQLMSEIDKIESQCVDIRLLDTDTYAIREFGPVMKKTLLKNGKFNMMMNDGRTLTDKNKLKTGNYILNILDPLLNMNLQKGFMIPTRVEINDKGKSKILYDINNLPMKLYPSLYNILSKIFDQFIPLFEQLLSCYLKNCIIDVIFQIQYYFIHPNTSYNGPYHREGFKIGEYIDAGGIYYFYKTPNVFTKDIFEIKSKNAWNSFSTRRRYDPGTRRYALYDNNKATQVEIKQGTCIVFENNIINHRLKTLVNENKNGIISKRGVLNFFLPKIQINSTISPINIENVNKHFYTSEKIVSYFVRDFNNDKSNIVLSLSKSIEMIIVKYLYLVANDQDYRRRNKFAKVRQGRKNRGKKE